MNNEEKLIAMKGFTAQMEKEGSLLSSADDLGKAFYKGLKSQKFDKLKGGKPLTKGQTRAHKAGDHVARNKTRYAVGGTGVTALGTGYALGS